MTTYRPLCLWPLAVGMSIGSLVVLFFSDAGRVFSVWFGQMLVLGLVWFTHRRRS